MWYSIPFKSDELYHHGIKGMRWGVRRWQNDDGSLTPAGQRHYYKKGYVNENGQLTKAGYNRGYRQDSRTGSISRKTGKLINPNYNRQKTIQVVRQMEKRGDPNAKAYAQMYGVNDKRTVKTRNKQYVTTQNNAKKTRRKRALSILTKLDTQRRKPKIWISV